MKLTRNFVKLPPSLKLILDRYFEIHKIDLVIEYIVGKDNNKIEVKKIVKYLETQAPLKALFLGIIRKNLFSTSRLGVLSFFIKARLPGSSKNLKKQFKEFFINKIRNDAFYVQSSSLFSLHLIHNLFIDSIYDRAFDIGTSILRVLFMYYVILPFLLPYIVDNSVVIDDYINEKISLYKKLLNSTSNQYICARYEELKRDYKDLFVQINNLRQEGKNQEIPSLKYLAAFYVKNNTDIDVNKSQIPEDIKEYIMKI